MKFENLSFIKKLWLMSFTLIATIAAESILAHLFAKDLRSKITTINEVLIPAQRNVMMADMQHDALRATIYRSIIAMDRSDTDELESSISDQKIYSEKFLEAIESLAKISLSKEITDEIDFIKPSISKYIEESKKLIQLIIQGKSSEATKQIPEFQKTFKFLEQRLGSLGDMINKEIHERNKAAEKSTSRNEVISTITILIGLFIGITYSKFTIKNLESSILTVINSFEIENKKLTHTSAHLKKTSKSLADSASKQAASIEETVASMEEISSMMNQTTQGSSRCKELTQQGAKNSSAGKDAVSGLMTSMTDFEHSNAQLEKMVSLITEISNKTTVINEIVFESRLLAFNASIEAARAGVYGKGFAVVAEEVGKLAVMSGKASSEISVLLESSRLEVSRIVGETRERIAVAKKASENCSTSFLKMAESFTSIEESATSIAKATREQEIGIKQTNISMNNMDKITQNNLQNAGHVLSEVQILDDVVKSISGANQSFKAEFYGRNSKHLQNTGIDTSEFYPEKLMPNDHQTHVKNDFLQSANRALIATEETHATEPKQEIDEPSRNSEIVSNKTPSSRWKKAS